MNYKMEGVTPKKLHGL